MTTFLAWLIFIVFFIWLGGKPDRPKWPQVRVRGERDRRNW